MTEERLKEIERHIAMPSSGAVEELVAEVRRLRGHLRNALNTLDMVRGSCGIDQSVAVEAIDRCLEENKAVFCEGMRP